MVMTFKELTEGYAAEGNLTALNQVRGVVVSWRSNNWAKAPCAMDQIIEDQIAEIDRLIEQAFHNQKLNQ